MVTETKHPNNKKKATRRGKRGKGASEKRAEKHHKKYIRKVSLLRSENRLTREYRGGCHGFSLDIVYPVIELGRNRDWHNPDFSSQTLAFYQEHEGGNRFLTVSDRPNTSNPEGKAGGGKGVFAIVNIPKDTRVCFYTGVGRRTACAASVHCDYCLQVTEDFYLCAREQLYDLGYLMGCLTDEEAKTNHGAVVKLHGSCAPNYGRYINTTSKLLKERPPYNCAFELGDDGHDVMWVTTCLDVKEGEELLIDYGSSFCSS